MLRTLLCMMLVGWTASSYSQNNEFTLGGYVVKRGERKSFTIPVKAINGGATFIPVTIENGDLEGETPGLLAGIHGYEYPPIIAMQKFPDQLDLKLLKETIIVVHMAKPQA